MELLIALRALAERFPRVQVATAPEALEFRKISAVYGIEALPVHLYGHALVDCGA
jgi:cytochrome P450